ncbi:hypothetical protein ACET3Z_021313 [Daucus carota]
MAPMKKYTAPSGFIYEKNNFASFVDIKAVEEKEYHRMMEFIKSSQLSYAMLEAPTIYHEIVKEMWTSAEFNSEHETLTFSVNNEIHSVNADVMKACFKIPEDTVLSLPSDNQLVNLLYAMNYVLPTDALGKIERRGLRREWSYLCDAFIKAFSGKISNFNALTSQILQMLYMYLTNEYFNFGGLMIQEIGEKLGDKIGRPRNIYYVRFLMMLANHLNKKLVITNKEAKLPSFVQEKRVFKDLFRMNLYPSLEVVYLPTMEAGKHKEVHGFPTTLSQPSPSLLSAIRAVEEAHQQSTQVAKPSKNKSSKPTSDASQKTSVVKSKKHKPEGSVIGGCEGEGKGEHKRSPKNKDGEMCVNQPSHSAVSQKTVDVNMELNSSLAASSQKDVAIENSPQPGTQLKRGRDTTSSPVKAYGRKKLRSEKLKHSAHTQASILDFMLLTSQSQIDVTPINVESQPPSSSQPITHIYDLTISTTQTQSPTSSVDVELIHTTLVNSPSLDFMEKPPSEIDHHHFDDLLDLSLPFLSSVTMCSVDFPLKSITTDSTVTASKPISSFSSTDLPHQLTSVCPSTDLLNSSHQLNASSTHVSTDVSHQLTTAATSINLPLSTAVDHMVAQTLLGLSGVSYGVERQPSELAKGEGVESLAFSSSQEKGEDKSDPLVRVSEGEVSGVVSQGEPLMQEQREIERNAGVNEGFSEQEFQAEYRSILDGVSLDPETFTHGMSSIQDFARLDNQAAERHLNLIHTTSSMLRAKEAFTALPANAGDDFHYDDSDEDLNDALEESLVEQPTTSLPSWLSMQSANATVVSMELERQASTILQSQPGSSSSSPVISATIASQALDNLKLHKFQSLHFQHEIEHLNSLIASVKTDLTKQIDEKLPAQVKSALSASEQKQLQLEKQVEALEGNVYTLNSRMDEMLQHQRIQTGLLQHLLLASGVSLPSSSPTLAANKKGEKELPTPAELISQIPPPFHTEREKQKIARMKELDSIAKRVAQLGKKSSTSSTATTAQISFPTTTTILRVITPEIVIPSKTEKGEPSFLNEFKPILFPNNCGYSRPGKDSSSIYFPLARPDKNEYKLLGQEIKSYKDCADVALKAHFAIIYREGQKLFIGTGHPHYSFAKAEEVARECEKEEFESQLSLNQIEVDERYAIDLEEELAAELLNEKGLPLESSPKKKRVKSKTKMPEAAKRREEVPEKPISKPSSPIKDTTVVHPDVNFHDEPIMPKEEPIDLEDIPIPAFLVQESSKPKKKVKSVAKRIANPPKPPKEPENPDDYLIIANIEEISELDLELDDLQGVRGIEATSKLPERLVFSYKNKGDVIWPLHRVLNSEGFSSLTKIYGSMKRTGGFTPPAKQMVLKRILEIRKEWNSDASLQRRLKIPYTGKKIHHEPTPVMEFRDNQGVRRFFRPKDQLKVASLNTLKTLQSKLNRQDSDEEWFYRIFQKQINILEEKLKSRRRRSSRNK